MKRSSCSHLSAPSSVLLASVLLASVLLASGCGGAATTGETTDTLGGSGSPNGGSSTTMNGGDGESGSGTSTARGGSSATGSVSPSGGADGTPTTPGGGSGTASGGTTPAVGGEGGDAAPGGSGGASTGVVVIGGTDGGGTSSGGTESGSTVITAGAAGDAPYCTDTTADGRSVGRVDASAGTFEDGCTEEGDLVEHSCEYLISSDLCPVTGPASSAFPAAGVPLSDLVLPPCDFTQTPTGNVIRTVTDCGGRCEEGTCPNLCPTYDETMVFQSVDAETGAAVFAFDRAGHDLSCELIFDREDDTYDCRTDPEPGLEILVPSLGLSSRFCIEGNIGNVGMDDPSNDLIEECAYRCDVVAR